MSLALEASFLTFPFMQRALIGAILVGLCAPAVGIYLVQRQLSLLGDGIGHIAFAGVGLGILTGTSPVLTAVVVAIIGAVVTELVRSRTNTNGDLALAVLFYGGLATGALLISFNGAGASNIQTYLFGSILTVNRGDLVVMASLAAVVLLVTVGLRKVLFAASQDGEFARASGLPVGALNIVLAVTAAITITVAMRVVGLLLVSALLVLPVAATSRLAASFTATLFGAMALGVATATGGVILSYPLDVAPGSLIVVLAIALFFVAVVLGRVVRRT